jgi:hypothetical protein
MNKELTLKERLAKFSGYYSVQELGIIVVLAVIAFLTSSYGLAYILPGGNGSGFVHGFLKLPGPGAGIFISSAFICLWFVLGLLLIKKTGTAIIMAILVVAFTLVLGLLIKGNMRFDYLLVLVAIIIEIAGLLPLDKKPWNYIFPPIVGILGVITLALMLTGNAKMGENGAAANVFPLGYAVTGILALCLAVICYYYPMKYVVGAGFAEMFYIVFCWLFNGKSGFATWVPVTPAIPPLLTFSLVCGAVMALLAYCIFLLFRTYQGEGPLARMNQ